LRRGRADRPNIALHQLRNRRTTGHRSRQRERVSTCDKTDYPGGLGGRRITKDAALNRVAGYSIFNDATLRDYQIRTPQWTVGKNFDRTGAFGPWLVTPDALPPGAKGLRIQVRLNGRTVQDSNTNFF